MEPGYEELPSAQAKYNVSTLLFISFVANLGGLLFGYVTSVISGANLYLYSDLGFDTDEMKQAVVSITLLGALIGSLCGGQTADALGRKTTILVSDLLYIIGGGMMGLAPSIYILLGGRLVAGLGVGLTAMVIPMYLAEISPAKYRGVIIGTYTFCIVGGQFGSLVVCLLLDGHWRWMLGGSTFVAMLQLLGAFYCPESPRWLCQQGDIDKAHSVIRKVYNTATKEGKDSIDREVVALKAEVETLEQTSYWGLLKELLSKNRKATMVGCGLQALQQLSGINTAMYYGPSIMQKAGFNGSGAEALRASLPLFGMGVLGMFIAVLMIDRAGRRTMLLWTVPFMTVCLAGLALGFWVLNYSPANAATGGYLCLVFIMLYVGFFGSGLGPIPWTVNAEIFPTHLRSVANSWATATNWVFNIIVSMTFLTFTASNFGQVAAWVTYCGFGLTTWLFVFFFLPETKGKTLESILKQFASDS